MRRRQPDSDQDAGRADHSICANCNRPARSC